MLPSERDAAYLWDTERQVEIIGEAASRVSTEFQNSHPEIPWRQIIGQRNVLAHEYRDIAPKLLWTLATEHIQELAELLEPLAPKTPQGV